MDQVDIEERLALLTALKENLGGPVTPTAWAFLWLSDIDQLRDLSKFNPHAVKSILRDAADTAKIPQRWMQRFRETTNSRQSTPMPPPDATPDASPPQPATPTSASKKRKSTGGTVFNRSVKEKELVRSTLAPLIALTNNLKCKRRDSNRCLITEFGKPNQIAHIFPFSLLSARRSPPTEPDFWEILKIFWTTERVQRWQDSISLRHSETGLESCYNMLCLSHDAHAFWNAGYFALQPIEVSADQKSMNVKFEWLPQYEHSSTVDLLEVPRSSHALSSGPNVLLSNVRTRNFLTSGDIITFTTTDPSTMPLPSWPLLEMQYILNRLVALRGAGQQDQDDEEEDDEDGLRQPRELPMWGSGYDWQSEDESGLESDDEMQGSPTLHQPNTPSQVSPRNATIMVDRLIDLSPAQQKSSDSTYLGEDQWQAVSADKASTAS